VLLYPASPGEERPGGLPARQLQDEPMPHVTCPACGATAYVGLDAAHRLIKCTRCSAMFLASGPAPRRRWGCGTALLVGFLVAAGSLWLALQPMAGGDDREFDSPVSPRPPADARPR
jgi:hypothetical protein